MNRQEAWVEFATHSYSMGIVTDTKLAAKYADEMLAEFGKRFDKACPVCGHGIPPAAGPMAREVPQFIQDAADAWGTADKTDPQAVGKGEILYCLSHTVWAMRACFHKNAPTGVWPHNWLIEDKLINDIIDRIQKHGVKP